MRKIDAWAGKTLFIPIIIKLCQVTRMSQHAFSNYASIASFLYWLWAVRPGSIGMWIGWVLMGVCAVSEVVVFALRPDIRISPTPFIRRMSLILLVLDLFVFSRFIGFWLFILFREYAREIDTIPPPEAKERKTQAALVPARVRK